MLGYSLATTTPVETVCTKTSNLTLPVTVTSRKLKAQLDTVNNFRKGILNLLVATSVAEEGLNIKKCKFVIRFDGVTRYAMALRRK